MKEASSGPELLVRYLDGRLTAAERAQAVDLLRSDPAARSFVREVAEQAVALADLGRTAAGREQPAAAGPIPTAAPLGNVIPVNFRAWPRWLAVAAVVALLLGVAIRLLPSARPGLVQVSKVTGASQLFGANGRTEAGLTAGTRLGAGDTLETPSCDAWIVLTLKDGSTLTVASHSTLRILEPEAGTPRFKLLQGSLWRSPAAGRPLRAVRVETPVLSADLSAAQFDIQSSADKTLVRINQGSAEVRQHSDGSLLTVPQGHQVAASLNGKVPLAMSPQPEPINYWSCDLWQVPEVILGRWLPPNGQERARLGAEPLLWPVSKNSSLMLYAAALAAWKSTEHPVLLRSDSKLVFRGRTERSHTVRFGFSAQKIRGVFAGKFEVDIPAADLGPAGATWEVALPLSRFRPLQPQLSASPDDLELTDVYALTVKDDAGLEINHIELVPVPASGNPSNQ